MTVMYLPPGYKTSTNVTYERTEHGRNVQVTDHFDGSRDATVKVKALRLSFTAGATPNREHVAAIAELEEATREHRLAEASGNTGWVAYTSRRLAAANVRVLEVQ